MAAEHGELAKAARIPVDRIRVHPRNIRSKLTRIESLARSVKAEGVLQPLVVHQKFRRSTGVQDLELIAGHRRLAAAEIAGLLTVPCIVMPQMRDDEAILAMLAENTQRRAVPASDLSRAIAALRDEFNYTDATIAAQLGIEVMEVRLWARGQSGGGEGDPGVAAIGAVPAAPPRTSVPRRAPNVHRQTVQQPRISPRRVHELLAEHDRGDLAAADVITRLRGALGGWAPASQQPDPTTQVDFTDTLTYVDQQSGVITERELQVLRYMSTGRSNGEIGSAMYLAEDTVKTHARRLFRKLGARDRAHAVALGIAAGHITLPSGATPAVVDAATGEAS